MKKYFISGVLTILPIAFFYLIIKSISSIFNEAFVDMNIFLSFLLSIVLITFLGFLVTNFLSKRIKKNLNKKTQQKGLLSEVIKFFLNMDEISKNTKKVFERPVLYKVDDGIFELGYISNESFAFLDFEEKGSEAEPDHASVWIYIPAPFSFMGSLKLVEKRKIKKIENEKKEEISLFILSAGISKK
jgi:uncharacterized membrane protein